MKAITRQDHVLAESYFYSMTIQTKGLQLLNLSNNDISGQIPTCLGHLTNLESLDLLENKLSTEIPQQLALLTFLAFLNVSNNNLTGLIPQGKQFNICTPFL
ncbi:hypothetical protein ACSBR2_011919 [Camellia fascicularis]